MTQSAGQFGRAFKWSLVMQWGARVANALTMLLLASLLGPTAFGLVALANVFVLFMQLLVDPGMTPALIQRRDLRQTHLDAAFWLVVGLSIALALASYAASGWWASANEAPELQPIIAWLSLRLPLHGLTIVQQSYLRREMDFKSLALRANAAVITGAIVGVVVALLGYGYWALVAQQLSESFFGLLLLWRMSPWRPGLRFDAGALRELSGFSAAVFLSNIGAFVYRRADAAVMGLFFGPTVVGIYRLAMRLMSLCGEIGTQAVFVVSLTEFSRQRHDPEALRHATLRSIHLATVMTVTLLAGLAAIRPELLTLLSPEWEIASLPILVLCVLGYFQVISVMSTPLLQAVGRPFVGSILTWIWGSLAVGGAFAVASALQDESPLDQVLGISAMHALFCVLLHLPVYAWLFKTICDISPLALSRAIAPAGIAAVASTCTAELIRAAPLVAQWAPIPRLVVAGGIAAIVYAALLLVLDGRARNVAADQWAKLRA